MSDTRKKSMMIRVRVSPEEYKGIQSRAGDTGLTPPEYMRRCSLGRQTRSKIEERIINELRKLGGLQKHLFNEGGGKHGDEYAAVLKEITAAIKRIGGEQ